MPRIASLLALASLLWTAVPAFASDDGPRPWLGLQLGPGSRGGVAIKGVMENSPGDRAGVRAGEEVLDLGGKKVTSAAELIAAVGASHVGERIALKLTGGAAGPRTVEVMLTGRPDDQALQRQSLLAHAAPDFTPKVMAGARLANLSSLRGQVVVLDFFATWCGPCREAMPALEHLHARLGKKGLRIVGISSEEPPVVAAAASRFHISYTLVSDEDHAINDRYRVFALPTIVVVDKRGLVHSISVADTDTATQAVAALLDEK